MKNSKPNEEEKELSAGTEEQYERIQNIGSVIKKKKNKKIYCLTIIGQIEGHNYLPKET